MVLVLIKSTSASNEYQQHMFPWRNKKNVMWISILSVAMNEYLEEG